MAKPLNQIDAKGGTSAQVCPVCPNTSPRHFHLHTKEGGITNPFYSVAHATQTLTELRGNGILAEDADELLARVNELGLSTAEEDAARNEHYCDLVDRLTQPRFIMFEIITFERVGGRKGRGPFDSLFGSLPFGFPFGMGGFGRRRGKRRASGTEPIRVAMCDDTEQEPHAYVMSKTNAKLRVSIFSSKVAGRSAVQNLLRISAIDTTTAERLLTEVGTLALPETDKDTEKEIAFFGRWCDERPGAIISFIETGTLENEFDSATCSRNPFG